MVNSTTRRPKSAGKKSAEIPFYSIDSVLDDGNRPFNSKGDRKVVVSLEIHWSGKPNEYITRKGVEPRGRDMIALDSLKGHKGVIISNPNLATMYKLEQVGAGRDAFALIPV